MDGDAGAISSGSAVLVGSSAAPSGADGAQSPAANELPNVDPVGNNRDEDPTAPNNPDFPPPAVDDDSDLLRLMLLAAIDGQTTDEVSHDSLPRQDIRHVSRTFTHVVLRRSGPLTTRAPGCQLLVLRSFMTGNEEINVTGHWALAGAWSLVRGHQQIFVVPSPVAGEFREMVQHFRRNGQRIPFSSGMAANFGGICFRRLLRLVDLGMFPFRRMVHLGTVRVHALVPGRPRWFLFLLPRLVSLIVAAVGHRPELSLLVAAQGSTQMIYFLRLRPVDVISTPQNVLGVGRRTIILKDLPRGILLSRNLKFSARKFGWRQSPMIEECVHSKTLSCPGLARNWLPNSTISALAKVNIATRGTGFSFPILERSPQSNGFVWQRPSSRVPTLGFSDERKQILFVKATNHFGTSLRR
jgi:hypothetical protein